MLPLRYAHLKLGMTTTKEQHIIRIKEIGLIGSSGCLGHATHQIIHKDGKVVAGKVAIDHLQVA